jgi:hypothetical protein
MPPSLLFRDRDKLPVGASLEFEILLPPDSEELGLQAGTTTSGLK